MDTSRVIFCVPMVDLVQASPKCDFRRVLMDPDGVRSTDFDVLLPVLAATGVSCKTLTAMDLRRHWMTIECDGVCLTGLHIH